MPPNMRLLSHNNESFHSVNMTETIREKFIQERQRSGTHWTNIIKDKAIESLSADNLKSFLPITKWLPTYNKDKAVGDFTAGLTVALTVIPQSLAYANLAGLPVQYGLYSSFMGVFLYTLLGTSKDVTLGPTAIMSLIVSQYGAMEWFYDPENTTDPRCAVILTLASGILLLIMSVFKLGFLVNYVSHAVICGFTCAASIIIAFSQVKKLLGLKGVRRHFYEAIVDVPRKLPETRWQDLTIGLICMVILHALKICKQKFTDPKDFPRDSKVQSILRKIFWFVCTARNAFVIVGVSIVAYGMDPLAEGKYYTLTGDIQPGLPPFAPPPLSKTYWVTPDVKSHIEFVPEVDQHHRRRRQSEELNEAISLNLEEFRYRRAEPLSIEKSPKPVSLNLTVSRAGESPIISSSELDTDSNSDSQLKQDEISNLETGEVESENDNKDGGDEPIVCAEGVEGCVEVFISTGKTISKLMAGIFIVSIMGYVESIAIAKGFARKFNYKIDPGQELVAIGLCNVASAFVSSYPITGSFSRTAVNAQSGVQTPAGGIITGMSVVIATQFLTPAFKYIPTAALAAVIMLAAISMFDTDGVKHAWRVNKMDLFPLVVAFGICFYEIAIGIACGILVSLAIVLYPHARPNVEIDTCDQGKGCIIKMDRGFDFPGAEYLEDLLISSATYGNYNWIICDLSKISHLDLGGVDALYTAVNHCHKKEVAFRVIIPDEKLHSKLIAAGHNDEEQFRLKETISLTMGSALVQVGKRKLSESDNEEESDTPESDKNLKRRTTNAANKSGEPASSGGMFVPSPILYNDNNV